jgi:hypothetical protein
VEKENDTMMITEMIIVLFLVLVVSPCCGMVVASNRNRPIKLWAGEHGYIKAGPDGVVLVAVIKPSFPVIPARVDLQHVKGLYGDLRGFSDHGGQEWYMEDGNPVQRKEFNYGN